jgi:hypothetical protein
VTASCVITSSVPLALAPSAIRWIIAAFAAGFTTDPVLETSVLNGALTGIEAIDAFFGATAHGLYDSLKFTTETTDGRKIYLEWEGKVFGKEVGGTTILTRDATGLIENIRLYIGRFKSCSNSHKNLPGVWRAKSVAKSWENLHNETTQINASFSETGESQIVGNLAWEVGTEKGLITTANGKQIEINAFVTNIFQNIDDRWLLVSYQAAEPPKAVAAGTE